MKRTGFTLIELLLVIALVSVLFAIAVPKFGNTQRIGEDAACRANLQSIEMALEGYYSENGGYPAAGSLTALVSGGYLRTTPKCQDQGGNVLGSYTWKTDTVNATAFTFADTSSTSGTYRGGRAFCTFHGIVEAEFSNDWRPGGQAPGTGGGGGGIGGGG